jgi:hypothetical protein
MWKDSIDMISFNKYKEPFLGKLFSEVGQAASREGAQAVGEKLVTTTLKNTGESLIREGAQAGGRELTQATLKETGQSSGKKLFSSSSKKFTSEGSANLAESASKEFAQQTTKQTGQAGATSFTKKIVTFGALGGGAYAASKIKTDTNGDGIIDENDKSLLSQASEAAGGVVKDVTTPVLKEVLDVGDDLTKGLFEGLGIDIEALKEKFGEYVQYGIYFLYFILILIAIKVLSMVYSGLKVIGIVGRPKPITIIQPARIQTP